MGAITRDKQFTVKQKLYSVEEMIGRSEIVNRYIGGTYIIIYLSPRTTTEFTARLTVHLKRNIRWEARLTP